MRDMSPLERSEKFQIRLTPEEKEMLEGLAEHDGLSASDVVRQLIRAAHADVIGPPNPRPRIVQRRRSPTTKPKR
jgi:hypothetical protein